MINSVYVWLGLAVIIYVGSIVLLNRIPHVTVKSLGWFSIKHVTIQYHSTTVYIGKVQLRLNLFRGKESGLKLINLEIMDIDVKSFKKDQPQEGEAEQEGDTDDLTIKPTTSIGSIREKLSIKIPKRVYDFLLHYRIINQINIHIFRCTLFDEAIDEQLSIFIDYSRVESYVNSDGTAKLIVTLLHSYLHHSEKQLQSGESQTKLFRNVEFIIHADTALSCPLGDAHYIYCDPRNFRISLSIGRLSIPLDNLSFTRNEAPVSRKHGISFLNYIDEVKEGLSIFSQFELKLEELTLTHGDIAANVSNFVIVLSNELKYNATTSPQTTPSPPENILKLHFYVTSCKVYHRESKCFELPSATFTTLSNPLDLINVADSLINNKTPNHNNNFINSETSIMLTSPTFDIYHDQSDIFFSYCDRKLFKKQAPKSDSSLPFRFSSILYKLKEVSLRIVIVDMKVLVHVPNPKDSLSVFARNAKGNIIVTFSLMSFFHRFYTKNFNILLTNKKRTKRFSLNGLFKIKNFKLEAVGNSIMLTKVNVLAIYNICESNLSLKVSSKDFKIKSVNEVLFHLVREFRNRSIIHSNKRYTYLTDHQQEVCPTTEELNDPQLYIQLFEIAPKFISSFKASITNIQADIVCQDGLPSYKIFDEKLGKEVDLGDFKRGVSLRLNDIVFVYKKQKEDIDLSIKSLQMFTASEYATEYIEDFDHVEFQGSESEFTDMSSLNSTLSMDNNENEEDEDGLNTSRKVKKVLNIKEISLGNRSTLELRDINKLHLVIPEIDGRMDMFFLWCTIYAKTLVNYFAPTVERNCSKEEMYRLSGPQIKLKLDISVHSFATVVRLPNNVDVMIELDSLGMKNVLNTQCANLKYARLYVIHPATRLWTRLLVIKEPLIIFQKGETKIDSELSVVSSMVRLNIPHQFLFYTVIDNFMTLFKSIKQLNYNFKNLSIGISEFDRLLPEAREGASFPRVNVRTKMFGLTIENDTFENELSYIYELGLIEQRERLKKWKEFDKRVEELRASVDATIEEKIKLTNAQPPFKKGTNVHNAAPKYTSPLRQFFSESDVNQNDRQAKDAKQDPKPISSSEDIEKKINIAKENLDRSIGSTWISKFKIFREVKLQSWKKRCLRAWGEDAISPIITEKFDILDRIDGPYLLGAVLRDLDLLVHNADIPDIDQFLYDYGKQQPKLEYSILVPLTYRIRSRSLYVFLRDYPLPLVSFPENHDLSRPTVNMYGDLIINEKLVSRKEEMRFIFVPFSPAATPDIFADSFYSVFIPRTLTPVKFMINFNCDLNTDRACMISWCKSYQSAMSSASMAFDNFTKPKIDDSPLGWWDKIALLLHGKINFNISNELCLHIKSSTNPYELVGKNAGFVFSWKNNVSLRINDNGNSKDLIILESDDFVLAIPNYSIQERKTWSLFYDEMEDYVQDIDSEAKKFNKRVMKLSSAEKVKWTLGVLLERNKSGSSTLSDDLERTSEFKPHYDVVVTSPKFEWHPDSYKDYRSDYIHLAISVISKSSAGNSHNAIYLTPLTFHYFFSWWNLLKNHTSLPIKQGNLFRDKVADPSHVKMGPHLITIKYQLVLEPLTLSHMYMHSFTSKSEHEKIAFTGLKGKFAKFSMDLHQRKEIATYVNEKLNIENKVQHLKMNEGEINAHEADIRFVNAIFKDTSMRGHLASFLNGNEHDSMSSPSYSDSNTSKFKSWIDNVDVFDNDFSWVDPDDFIELEVRGPLSPYPRITVIPFCFSPKFSYVREYSLQKDGAYPFGHEESHDCLMGMAQPENTQALILMKRIRSLEEDMKISKAALERLRADPRGGHEKEISRVVLDLKVQEEKLGVVESLYESFAIPDSTNASDSESMDLARTTSRSLSVYSSHKSIDGFGEFIKTNSSVSQFHNRFIVHNLQLKWNNDLRDLFMEYIQRVGDRKSHVYYMSKRAVDLVESIINNQTEREEPTDVEEKAFKKEFKSGEEVINGFNDEIDDLESSDQVAEYKYLVKLIHPQIQLVSSKTVDSCMIITSRDLEMRIIAVHLGNDSQIISDSSSVSNIIETRYGVLFKDSHIFVFNNKDSKMMHPELAYGTEDPASNINWPPWVECEVCYDTSWARAQLVAERNSMALIFKKPNILFAENKAINQSNEIIVQLAKIVINATSEQYSTMFYVITDLLVHGKTKRDELLKRLDKIMSLSDSADFRGLDDRVRNLQFTIREYTNLLLKLDFRSIDISKKEKEQLHTLELELERSKVELNVLMKGLGSRYKAKTNKQSSRFWNILADQVIWHMLDENREPFIDFALASSRYTRIDSLDGSNINKVEISMIQGFNLQEKAVYPELLRPYLEGKDMNSPDNKESVGKCVDNPPIVQMTWKMLDAVGGIPVIQSAKLAIQPLKVELDYQTAKSAFEYLFPNSDSKVENDIVQDEADDYEDDSEDSVFSNSTKSRNPFKNFMAKHRSTGSGSRSSTDTSLDNEMMRSDTTSSRASSDEISLASESREKVNQLLKPTKKDKYNEDGDDISIIITRSLKYSSIIDIEVTKFKLFVSFKAPKHLNILDVHKLTLTIPNLRYKNKIWSGEDFCLKVRKDIIKIILNHTGKIIGNKFKYRKRNAHVEPLKQISDYASFMTIQDLQSEGRARDTSKTSIEENRHSHHQHHHHNLKKSRTLSSNAFAFEGFLNDITDDEEESDTSVAVGSAIVEE